MHNPPPITLADAGPCESQTYPRANLVFADSLPHGNWYWHPETESLWYARSGEGLRLYMSWPHGWRDASMEVPRSAEAIDSAKCSETAHSA